MIKLFEKKETPFLILDIGSEAVKSLIVKKENDNFAVLGAGLRYLNIDSFSTVNDFQIDSMSETVLRAIQEASNNFILFPNEKKEDLPVLMTLSPDILKLKIVIENFERKKESKISRSEAEEILKNILIRAKKRISNDFSKECGILANDIQWVNFKVIGRKINGYAVSEIQGCNGKNLEIKILGVFLPKKYFNIIERICFNLKLRPPKIMSVGLGLISAFGKTIKNGVFIDVGGNISQVLVLKDGILDQVKDFKAGGQRFSQALSEVLAIDEDSARVLKHKYADNNLSREVKEKVKAILSSEKDFWQNSLENGFKRLSGSYLFGGASLIPEIKDSFKSAIVYPKHLKRVKDLTKNLNSPQFTPALMILYCN